MGELGFTAGSESRDSSDQTTLITGENMEDGSSSNKVLSPIEEYLTTDVRVRLTCDSCKYTRTHNEKFWHLSLELDSAKDSSSSSVQDGLARFFASEKLELKCEKCFCESATQSMRIVKLPRALLLHFKRFIVEVSSDYSSISYRKNTCPVSFDSCMSVDESHAICDHESCFIEPSSILSEFLAPDCVVPKRQSQSQMLCCHNVNPSLVRYELKSVVNHIGSSASCGHYTADAVRNK